MNLRFSQHQVPKMKGFLAYRHPVWVQTTLSRSWDFPSAAPHIDCPCKLAVFFPNSRIRLTCTQNLVSVEEVPGGIVMRGDPSTSVQTCAASPWHCRGSPQALGCAFWAILEDACLASKSRECKTRSFYFYVLRASFLLFRKEGIIQKS